MKRHPLLLGVMLSLSMVPPATAERPASEWPQVTADDLHFIRAILRENHPGTKDESNPAFRKWFEEGFEQALQLASKAQSRAGYFFTIQRYMTGFQDSHLGALGDNRFQSAGALLKRQWPGLMIGLKGKVFEVVETSSNNPPIGAELVSCDGRSTETLANEIIRPYFGLWSVRGTRPRNAPFLLIDEGNPFVRRPIECSFKLKGKLFSKRLEWMPIANEMLASKVEAAQGKSKLESGVRRFGRKGWWISLPSFNANNNATSASLLEITRRIEKQPVEFRNADTIVFDVRGNTGGNSQFGTNIASALWGSGYIEAVTPEPEAVDWRLSTANVEQLEKNAARLRQRFGDKDERALSYAQFVEGMKEALAKGQVFYREDFSDLPVAIPPSPVRAKIIFLTDGWCGSACLDFADSILAIPGVVHVGAETGADTIYIDNTATRLPSGEGLIGWSMKVHRGRPRGHNQSYLPKHVWTGSMDDTAGLERWILRLAKAQ